MGDQANLVYTDAKTGSVKLLFDTDSLKVIRDGEVIAIFAPEMVWSAVKDWIANFNVEDDNASMSIRKFEAQTAIAASNYIVGAIHYQRETWSPHIETEDGGR